MRRLGYCFVLLLLAEASLAQIPSGHAAALRQLSRVPASEAVANQAILYLAHTGLGLAESTGYVVNCDDDDGEDNVDDLPVPIPESAPPSNTADILQSGNLNLAFIEQAGMRNYALMQQDGNHNTSILLQSGEENVYMSWLVGNNNLLDIEQLGDQNTYVLHFTGSNLDHQLTQHGNGLTAIQIGVGSLPFSVTQTGDGASLSIIHNPGSIQN